MGIGEKLNIVNVNIVNKELLWISEYYEYENNVNKQKLWKSE